MGRKTIRKVESFKEEKKTNNGKCHNNLNKIMAEEYLNLNISEILHFCQRNFSR